MNFYSLFSEQKSKNTLFFRSIKYLTLILGFLGSLGFYSQAYVIWQNQASGSVSTFTYGYWGAINLVFALYMLMEDNKIVLTTSLANLLGSLVVMIIILIV